MSVILPVRGFTPELGANCWLAPNATVVGNVTMGPECTVWFNAVVRGDVNSIRIGRRTNIQDGAVVHCTYEGADTVIGSDVSIGHGAVVHGCQLGDGVLVGMKAVIMDGAVVGKNCIIAAGAVVLEGTEVSDHTVMAGVPARPVKQVGPEQAARLRQTAANYVMYASWYTVNPTQEKL